MVSTGFNTFVRSFLEPPLHHKGSVLLNRIGLQPMRSTWMNLNYSIRPKPTGPAFQTYTRQLDEDGMCVAHDFLPADTFERVCRAYHEYQRSANVVEVPNKKNTGVTWFEGPITNKNGTDPAAQIMIDALSYDPRILALASHVLRRPVSGPLLLGYQWLYLPEGETDDRDIEGALHADRHYPCVKAAFYINDNDEENGAYVFCPGSHRFSWARLKHEYEFSLRQRQWAKGASPAAIAPTARGRPVPNEQGRAEMRLREISVNGPANTLILSNNMGFHRRGQMRPGQSRKQIRILFYEYQSPLFGRLARRRYKRQRYGLT